MYIPSPFAESRLDILHAFIRAHDFATLITHGPAGIQISHVPALLLADRGPQGSLQFHLARANDHWQDLAGGAPAAAIFHGPHGYISPAWYSIPANVPTWNYVVVHVRGTPRTLSDDQLRDHLHALVHQYESSRPDGWHPDRLPPELFDKLQRAVVGFELRIDDLQGKWKLGQNRTRADRQGAIAGLRQAGDPQSATLADWMERALVSSEPG